MYCLNGFQCASAASSYFLPWSSTDCQRTCICEQTNKKRIQCFVWRGRGQRTRKTEICLFHSDSRSWVCSIFSCYHDFTSSLSQSLLIICKDDCVWTSFLSFILSCTNSARRGERLAHVMRSPCFISAFYWFPKSFHDSFISVYFFNNVYQQTLISTWFLIYACALILFHWINTQHIPYSYFVFILSVYW